MTTIKKLITALETDDIANIIEDENKDKIDIPSDTITTANDAGNVLGEIDELNDSIEEAEEDADTVEKIKDVAIKANDEEDGLSPIAAEMAAISLESIHRRLGIKKQHRLPALESFGSTNTRKQATVIAIEIFEETIKKIWEAIIIAFDKLWVWFIKFYNMLFDNAEKIKTTCINIKKLIEQIDESKLVNKPFQSHGARNAFTDIAKKFDKSTIIDVLDNVIDALISIPSIIKANDDILSSLIENLQYIKRIDATAHEKIHNKLQKAMDSNLLRLDKINQSKHTILGFNIVSSIPGIVLTKPLIKRKILVITKSLENNQIIKYNIKMSPAIQDKYLGDLDKDIDFVLSKGEMLEMLNKVGTIANILIENKRLPAKIKEYNNKIDEMLKITIKKIEEINIYTMKETDNFGLGGTPIAKKVEIKRDINIDRGQLIKYELRATIENYKKELFFVKDLIQNALGLLPHEGILASISVFYFIRDNAKQYSSNINVPLIFY